MSHGLPHTMSKAKAPGADRGTAAGTGVVLTEVQQMGGIWQKARLTLTNVHVPLVDEAAVVAYGGLKVFDFPEGLLAFGGASMDLALTKSHATGVSDTWDGDIGLGEVTASNNATLSGTEQNFVPTTATPQAVAGATTGDAKSTSTEAFKLLDGTATAKDAYLNILVDDTDHDVTTNPTDIIVNGTITLYYMMMGDL